MTTKRRTAIFLTRLGERAMCFNRRQIEDQRRQAAEKVAVERRAVKLGLRLAVNLTSASPPIATKTRISIHVADTPPSLIAQFTS
jgi:hypothetical protein